MLIQKFIQDAEKLHCEVMGGDQNKDLLSRNCMLEMCPCSTMDCQIVSD